MYGTYGAIIPSLRVLFKFSGRAKHDESYYNWESKISLSNVCICRTISWLSQKKNLMFNLAVLWGVRETDAE